MTSIRHITKLLNASKLNLQAASSQIYVIRLASTDPSKLHLQRFNPNYNFQVIRTLRSKPPSSDNNRSSADSNQPPSREEAEKQNNGDQQSKTSDGQEHVNIPPNFPLDAETVKKLRIFMAVILITTFGLSFIALGRLSKHANPDIAKALEEETIEFEEFVSHILPTGEVKHIIFFPKQKRAVAVLQPNAVINGEKYGRNIIPIKFERVTSERPDQFKIEIRQAEEKLGIPLTEAIPIQIFQGASFFKAIEFFIGFVIIGFLMTQYGRMIGRTIRLKRAEDAAKAAGKKSSPN